MEKNLIEGKEVRGKKEIDRGTVRLDLRETVKVVNDFEKMRDL